MAPFMTQGTTVSQENPGALQELTQSIRTKRKRGQHWCCVYGEWWMRDEMEETMEKFRSCSTVVLCSFLKTGLTAANVANSGDF